MSHSKIRSQFPNLDVKIANKPLTYLDSAATTLKPQSVIDAISHHYQNGNANIHRGIHTLSQQASDQVEGVRAQIKDFIHANATDEIIFTSGTTGSINLVAQCLGQTHIQKDDEILITEMEHHSNIVPWQMLCEKIGCTLQVVSFNDQGEIDLQKLEQAITPKTKMIACVHVSNTLGTINPIKAICALARQHHILTLIDGAQSICHLPINVQDIGCDFFAFSGHKIYGPTGIGVLYGKREGLKQLPPYQGGGIMVSNLTCTHATYNDLPFKFEAGTPHIAGIIGLGTALDFINTIGFDYIKNHDNKLLAYTTQQCQNISGLNILGEVKTKIPIISFTLKNIHPHDLGTVLDQDGIAIRTGNHCTDLIMKHFNINSASRISCGLYTTKEEIDICIQSIKKAMKLFQ